MKTGVFERTWGDEMFIASFKDEELEVPARTIGGAKQKAHEYFKPKKNERDLITVRKR